MTMDKKDKERLINVEAGTKFIKEAIGDIKDRLEKGDEKFQALQTELNDVKVEVGALKEGRRIIVGVASLLGAVFIYITIEILRFAFKKFGGS